MLNTPAGTPARSAHAPVQGFVLLVAIVFSLVNLGVDLLSQWADPRSAEAPA